MALFASLNYFLKWVFLQCREMYSMWHINSLADRRKMRKTADDTAENTKSLGKETGNLKGTEFCRIYFSLVRSVFSWIKTLSNRKRFVRLTLQRLNTENSKEIFPKKEIARPVCERFIYSLDRSAYSAARKYVDRTWEYIQYIVHRHMNVKRISCFGIA